MLTNPPVPFDFCGSSRFQPGEVHSRGLLRDCTTGCGTDGSICGTTSDALQSCEDTIIVQSVMVRREERGKLPREEI